MAKKRQRRLIGSKRTISVHYGERSQEWDLRNANYHQIVSLLMKVVKNLTMLRMDALE